VKLADIARRSQPWEASWSRINGTLTAGHRPILHSRNRAAGSGILIDEDNDTVAAGMVLPAIS
jgi:hypothetical protein